jgi:Ca2+-binding EF-hand superfamily protein
MCRWTFRRTFVLAGCLTVLSSWAAFGQKPAAAPEVTTSVQWNLLFIGPEQAVPLSVTVTADEGPLVKRRILAGMLLTRFDSDKDGQLSATEAALLPNGAKASGPALGEQWKTLDRSPTDESLSVDELTTYVNEQLGPAFQMSTRPPRLAQSVQLVERLDQDHDASISATELLSGIAMLRSSDLDDDESVSVGELQPFPRQQAVQRPITPEAIQAPIIPVDRDDEVRVAVDRVLSAYGRDANGQSVALTRIQTPDGQPEAIDADGNGRLNVSELTTWITGRNPVVTVVATLGKGRPSSVQVQQGTDQQTGARVSVTVGGAAVDVTALNNKFEQTDSTKLYRIRFLTSDRDKNGYLDETEYASIQLPAAFKDVDANGDGMLYRDEMTPFLEYDAIAIQARIEMMVGDEGKTLFELLDGNVDRRLAMREIREGFGRLASVDRNGDERVAQSELESRFRLTFSFGRNQSFTPNANPINMPLTPRLRSQAIGPTWYRRMDRNLDGDITWREFLGSREQFQRLDLNADEMIDVSEASATTETPTETPAP